VSDDPIDGRKGRHKYHEFLLLLRDIDLAFCDKVDGRTADMGFKISR
jgi:hypothetical protein